MLVYSGVPIIPPNPTWTTRSLNCVFVLIVFYFLSFLFLFFVLHASNTNRDPDLWSILNLFFIFFFISISFFYNQTDKMSWKDSDADRPNADD